MIGSGIRIFNVIAWLGLTVGALLLIHVFVVAVYPFNPLDVKEPIEVCQETVRAGENLCYKVDFCKHTDKSSLIQRYLSNSLDIQLDSMIVSRPAGCQVADLRITIPEDTPPGLYTIKHVAIYEYGSFRNIVVRYDTEEFEVVE